MILTDVSFFPMARYFWLNGYNEYYWTRAIYIFCLLFIMVFLQLFVFLYCDGVGVLVVVAIFAFFLVRFTMNVGY